MTDNTYNGWTNYATWRVALEIFDGHALEDILGTDPNNYTTGEVADMLHINASEILEMQAEGLALDYALAFLDEVNWYEIAKNKEEEA